MTTPSETIRIGICRIVASWASRSRVGLSPTSPLTDAGIRIDPPPSFAWASGTTPAATIAAEPAELAPAVRRVSHGLRTGPSRGCSALGEKPYSLSWLFPSGTSPVARNIRAKSPSRLARRSASHASVPSIVGIPATSTLSLTQVGTPAKKPGRGSRRLGPRPVEGLEGDPVELGLHPLGPRDGGLDDLGDRHLARVQRRPPDRPRRGLAEGVVGEGMDAVLDHRGNVRPRRTASGTRSSGAGGAESASGQGVTTTVMKLDEM